jgi:probable HAF family extracellular repeat protein
VERGRRAGSRQPRRELQRALAISPDGSLIVGRATVPSRTGFLDYHAFLHADGAMVDLNELLPPARAGCSKRQPVNDRGQIVGSGTLGGQQRGFADARFPERAARASLQAARGRGPRVERMLVDTAARVNGAIAAELREWAASIRDPEPGSIRRRRRTMLRGRRSAKQVVEIDRTTPNASAGSWRSRLAAPFRRREGGRLRGLADRAAPDQGSGACARTPRTLSWIGGCRNPRSRCRRSRALPSRRQICETFQVKRIDG